MAIKLQNIQIIEPVNGIEYETENGFYLIMPLGVTAGAVLAFKSTDNQGFVDFETITTSKICFIPANVKFKMTFASGNITLTKLNGYGHF